MVLHIRGTATSTPTLTRTPKPSSTPITPPTPFPGGSQTIINYTYDPLYRLTEANYSTGDYYHYTYDAVGNRLTETTQLTTTSYVYDSANRLTSVDGVNYTWDNNGNLLNDGVNTYAYDPANRLKTLSNQSSVSSYSYNGFGDRLRQTVNGNTTTFAMDLNMGLTQALSDGTNTYTYGLGRITQTQGVTTEYFLNDALGSVRQLTNAQGDITLANAYEPYGTLAQFAGGAQTSYGFTGEFTDPSGMVYLRARYYSPGIGRFQTRDTWGGDYNSPLSLNRWNYVNGNPINYTDPSGFIPCAENQNTDMNRYCILERSGYIDVEHFVYKKIGINDLMNVILPQQFGKYFGQITLQGPTLHYKLPFQHSITYLTALPSQGLPRKEVGRIALGMQITYEYGFETAQGIVDFRCYTVWGWFSHCSSFSNEDLPSDYLGMVSAIEGLSLEEMLTPSLLGPGEQSDSIPDEYWGNALPVFDSVSCLFGFCSNDNPFNDECTLKIYDHFTKKYNNQPWPSSLVVEPFGFGVYWGLSQSDFHILPPPLTPLAFHSPQVPR